MNTVFLIFESPSIAGKAKRILENSYINCEMRKKAMSNGCVFTLAISENQEKSAHAILKKMRVPFTVGY